MIPQTPAEFRAARNKLGLSQGGLASLFGIASDRTVRRWEAGTQDIPFTARVLIHILVKCPEARELLGVSAKPD